jgi:DNA-binding transcriptional MerR regulator
VEYPSNTSECWYKASEFAELTGVTVRTLHHYDKVGLLHPTRRTGAGYRLYSTRDFARLEQIVALKFVGFSLKDIKTILRHGEGLDVTAMLKMQREIILRKRAHLDNAIAAIERAESVARKSGKLDAGSLKQVVEVMNMENNKDWMMQYYSDEARQKLQERGKDWTPEKQAQISAEWAALFKDIDAAISEAVDPSSPRAQQLAQRWDELIGRFTGGDPEIMAGLKRLYADQSNWPPSFQKPFDDQRAAYIGRARASRQS